MRLETIARCRDLNLKDVRSLVERQERAAVRELLERLADISKPNDGAGLALLVLTAVARYATWLPDKLHILLEDREGITLLDVLAGSGGLMERIWPRKIFVFQAPIGEFAAIAEQLERRKENPFTFTQETRAGHPTLTAIMNVPPREPSMPPLPDRKAERTMNMLRTVKRASIPPADGYAHATATPLVSGNKTSSSPSAAKNPIVPLTALRAPDGKPATGNGPEEPAEDRDIKDIDDAW